MEKYFIKEAIRVFCITASSFPEGVMEAHQKLHSMLESTVNRQFYGISRPDRHGKIIYKAAVSESYAGEAEKHGCETFVIPAGEYISELITGWKNDVPAISNIFKSLLSYPEIDPNGFCLEIYLGEDDMRCMVKI